MTLFDTIYIAVHNLPTALMVLGATVMLTGAIVNVLRHMNRIARHGWHDARQRLKRETF